MKLYYVVEFTNGKNTWIGNGHVRHEVAYRIALILSKANLHRDYSIIYADEDKMKIRR